jgi:hypothetical protein
MNNLVIQRKSLQEIQSLLGRFVRAEIEPAEFIPKYQALFAPFDPPDLVTTELRDTERTALELFIRFMGGWFGEEYGLVPKRSAWEYGSDTEPYGWIDGPAYRRWISSAAQEMGIVL